MMECWKLGLLWVLTCTKFSSSVFIVSICLDKGRSLFRQHGAVETICLDFFEGGDRIFSAENGAIKPHLSQ